MTREEVAKAQALADEIVVATEGPVSLKAAKLRRMLVLPPTIEEVLELVPGATITERMKRLRMTRQSYYRLMDGGRPSPKTLKKLARATGLREEDLRSL